MNAGARTSLALLGLMLAFLPVPVRADCPSIMDTARLALAILERRPLPPPVVPATMDEARCARDRLIATLSQPWGDQVGWKLVAADDGTPLIGGLYFATLRARAGETFAGDEVPVFPADYGTAPRIGAGLLLRIRYDGVGEVGDDHVSLLRHVDALMPFLDLGDRIYGADAPWSSALLLALNLGTRLGVAGAPVAPQPSPAFARALGEMAVTLGAGDHSAAAIGGGPLGHPLDAFRWLARAMREGGRRLQVGEHVLIMLAPALPAARGEYRLVLGGLSERPVGVAVRLE
jgi:2-keto-4-pentenoate hydratase